MSKPKHERALADHEAQAILSNVRTSPRKLNLVAAMIRNLPAQRAIATLTFSKRRIAHQVRKTLESAIANAENNHQLDVDRLIVTRAEVGRSIVMRRFHARVSRCSVARFGIRRVPRHWREYMPISISA